MSNVSLQPVDANAAVDPGDDERRRFNRAGLVVRIDYSTIDEIFSEFTRDINEGGLQVETDAPREVGTEVTMHFHLPGTDTTLSTQGTVVWARPPSDDHAGSMGIEFEELSSNDRIRINEIVRTLRSPA